MPLELTIDWLDAGAAVITIHGPLTLGTNLKVVESQVQQVISDGVDRLIIDMTECLYSDSAGLGFLIHTYGLIDERGGSIRMCGVSERILTLLQRTKTDHLIPCDADRKASVDNLRGPAA